MEGKLPLTPSCLARAYQPWVKAVAPTHVTPLRFHAADAAGGRSRRLGTATGYGLHGNVHTLGYFSADVCLGNFSGAQHSHGQRFDLIVDTGSALIALPCEGCSECGTHTHAHYSSRRYDARLSTTGNVLSCGDSACVGHRCADGADDVHASQCAYANSYTEGSSIRGHMVAESFWFATAASPGAPPNRISARATFGCQTFESGLFRTQVADGIVGFTRTSVARGASPTLFDSLRAATGAPDVFSICLSRSVGAMVLGGRLSPDTQSHIENLFGWIPVRGSDNYDVELVDVTIDGASIATPSSAYEGITIVDTGTTFMYLPPAVYARVRDHWIAHCPWGTCSTRTVHGDYPDDYCYAATAAEIDAFSPYALVFAAAASSRVTVTLNPSQYAYELHGGVWCLGIFDGEGQGAVIGGASMRDYEVIFDREHSRIGFVPSDCGRMHSGEHSSLLEGGYGLDGCAADVDPLPPAPVLTPPGGYPPARPPVATSPAAVLTRANATLSGDVSQGGDASITTEVESAPADSSGVDSSAQAGAAEAAEEAEEAARDGRGRTGSEGAWAMDEVWLLANTTSWMELTAQLEHLHPGAVAAIAISSTLLCCLAALGLCWLRLRFVQMSREYEERLRLVSAGQELAAFDEDERAAVAAAVEVPSQLAQTLIVDGK